MIDSAFTAFNPAVHPAARKALEAVKLWVKDAYSGDGRGLVLWASMKHGSGYGNGKTLLAKLAANALYSTLTKMTVGGELPDRSGILVGTEQLKSQIMDSYESHSTAEYLKAYRRARFIIIDDFGTEYVKADSLGWWQEQLYKIFNHAYDARQPIMITSNMMPDEMQARMGGKNWSRVYGLCQASGFINMSEIPDQRRKAAAK